MHFRSGERPGRKGETPFCWFLFANSFQGKGLGAICAGPEKGKGWKTPEEVKFLVGRKLFP
jgi:hypothetical protein